MMMMMPNSEAAKDPVYIDSGPLAAIGRGPCDHHYVGSVRLFEAIRESGCRAITSPLGHMEARHVVAKRTAGSFKCRFATRAEWNSVDTAVRGELAHLDDLMLEMKNSGILRVVELGWSPDLGSLYAGMRLRAGRLLAGIKGRPFWYREVGPCDLVHFAIAKYLGALVICTTDAAFADMRSTGEFGRIQVQLAQDLPSGRLAERPF